MPRWILSTIITCFIFYVSCVEKYDTEDKLLEALKRESKVNRIAKRPIDELPVYNPLQSEKSKKLERLM